ncbi:Uncharacterised protein [Mycobacteroides abscessus subsp. abscessus]|nr:Uncharacterised protein [Mycobacteroides abscessus subsp. abscessus]
MKEDPYRGAVQRGIQVFGEPGELTVCGYLESVVVGCVGDRDVGFIHGDQLCRTCGEFGR